MGKDSVTRTLIDIFAAPAEAFGILRNKPRVLFPLVLLLACNVGVTLVYVQSVNIPWMVEQNLQTATALMSQDQKQQVTERISKMSPMAVTVTAAVRAGLSMLVLLFLPAAYLALISLVTNDGYKLSRWFALVCWCALPVLVALLASLINVLIGDASHLAPERMNPLSFGNLFGLAESSGGITDRLVRGFDLTSIWSLALLILGYQTWTSKSLAKSAGIVLAPAVVLVALALSFALK